MGRISEEGRSLERISDQAFSGRADSDCRDLWGYDFVYGGRTGFSHATNIVEAGMRALKTGKTKYAPNAGIPELKRAVSEYLKRDYGVYYDSQTQILITPSGHGYSSFGSSGSAGPGG